MLLFIRMAWRNIWRNLRRTFITLAAITFGLASVIIFFGFFDGFHTQWIENTVRVYNGHMLIHAAGYREEFQLDKSMKDVDLIIERISEEKTLESYTARIHVHGLSSTAENSSGVLIRGIDTVREAEITSLDDKIIEGKYLKETDRRAILLGYGLAKRLKAVIGDKVVLMVQAADGSLGAELFRLKGIFKLGALDLDKLLAVITIEDAQDLAVLGKKVTELALIMKSPEHVYPTANRLKNKLEPLGYEIKTWQEIMPAANEMINLNSVFMHIILVVVLVVVLLGILNTMLMSIMERTREFGIMMALGTKPKRIIKLIILESHLIGLIGTFLGIVVGIGVNSIIAIKGFDLSQWSKAMELVASIHPVIYPEFHFESVFWSSIAIFVTSIIASIYPALRAARLKPVDAMHFV